MNQGLCQPTTISVLSMRSPRNGLQEMDSLHSFLGLSHFCCFSSFFPPCYSCRNNKYDLLPFAVTVGWTAQQSLLCACSGTVCILWIAAVTLVSLLTAFYHLKQSTFLGQECRREWGSGGGQCHLCASVPLLISLGGGVYVCIACWYSLHTRNRNNCD